MNHCKARSREIMTKNEKRRFLAEIILDPAAKMSDRLYAIEIDSKLAGHFAPKRHLIDIGQKTLDCIKGMPTDLGSLGRIIVN